jgi:hypothetical protein
MKREKREKIGVRIKKMLRKLGMILEIFLGQKT